MMTPEMIDGLSVTLVVTLATCVLCPIFWWILPDRTAYAHHKNGNHAPIG